MGFRYKDLTGQTFGALTAIAFSHTNKNNAFWICTCACGSDIHVIRRSDYLQKNNSSCGCIAKKKLSVNIHKAVATQSAQRRTELLRQTFEELFVLKFSHVDTWGNLIWECQCSCGSIGYYSTNALKSGHARSCGCIRSFKEREIAQFLSENNITFQKEYTFDNCLSDNNRRLRFDFAIFVDSRLIGLIEYHGEQHYDLDNAWNNVGYRERDKKKEKYCETNSIPLLILNKDNYSQEAILTFHNKYKQEKRRTHD